MAPPRFDPTFNLGHVLTIVTLLASGVAAWTSVNSALENHELRITRIEDHEKSNAQFPGQVLNMDARLRAAEQMLDRGRAERLEFQRQTAQTQQQILEALSVIREDLAALRAANTGRGAR